MSTGIFRSTRSQKRLISQWTFETLFSSRPDLVRLRRPAPGEKAGKSSASVPGRTPFSSTSPGAGRGRPSDLGTSRSKCVSEKWRGKRRLRTAPAAVLPTRHQRQVKVSTQITPLHKAALRSRRLVSEAPETDARATLIARRFRGDHFRRVAALGASGNSALGAVRS